MKKILPVLMVFACLIPCMSCKSAAPVVNQIEPIANGVIDCAKAEADVVGKQVSVLQVGFDVAQAIIGIVLSGGNVVAAVDTLIAKYQPILGPDAEALVACAANVVQNGGALPVPGTGSAGSGSAVVASGSGSGSAVPMAANATAMAVASVNEQAKSLAAQVIASHGWKFAPQH